MKESNFFSTRSAEFSYRSEEILAKDLWVGFLPSTRGFVIDHSDAELAAQSHLPEQGLHRKLSRSGLILMTLFRQMNDRLIAGTFDPRRVGIYGSSAKSSAPTTIMARSMSVDKKALGRLLLREWPPKQSFREGLNIPPAQLAIFLKVMGPTHGFPNFQFGALHALMKAEMDFAAGAIDGAIVFGAAALDSPSECLEILPAIPPGCFLKEGAAALILHSLGEARQILERIRSFDSMAPIDDCFFGHSHALLQLGR